MKKSCLFLFCFIFFGCNFLSQYVNQTLGNEVLVEIDAPEQKNTEERKWTIFMYMCGDNNLESAALDDIYEMETSSINTDEVNVVFLIDRNPSYNSAYENWSGTRLYKLKTGRKENQLQMISTELDCKELNLYVDKDCELDMAEGNTLSTAISSVFNRFPATHYGLIMWGHGSGWKNDETLTGDLYKGFAYDETSDSYLSLKQLKIALENGLKNYKLDFLGFDTCYGAELEIMYELRNQVNKICGSEGLISTSGWNYKSVFNEFEIDESKSADSLLQIIHRQFAELYTGCQRASFCVCNLNYIDDYFYYFDRILSKAAELIESSAVRDEVFSLIYASKNSPVEKYSYGKEGYDIYFDVYSLCEQLCIYFNNPELDFLFQEFYQVEKDCIEKNWASDRERGGLGVYFQTLGAGGLLQTSYNSNYVKDKTYNQIDFVKDSYGYVPTLNQSVSFLDKLFYFQFEE